MSEALFWGGLSVAFAALAVWSYLAGRKPLASLVELRDAGMGNHMRTADNRVITDIVEAHKLLALMSLTGTVGFALAAAAAVWTATYTPPATPGMLERIFV